MALILHAVIYQMPGMHCTSNVSLDIPLRNLTNMTIRNTKTFRVRILLPSSYYYNILRGFAHYL